MKVLAVMIIIILFLIPVQVNAQITDCVESRERTILIYCDTNISDIQSPLLQHLLNDSLVLTGDIVVDNATLSMSDIWLKMSNDSTISVLQGKLSIDNSKITSWNGSSVIAQNENGTIARPSIMMYEGTGGHIRNSTLANLGYERVEIGFSGLELQKETHDFEISNSEFYDNWMAFYSNRAYNITIDNNIYHDNLLYALDPHTRTHDMNITNNLVYDNHGFGIICSLNCYDILVENNTVYNNGNAGIMFSRNTTNSKAINNTVYDNPETYGIFVSQSSNNTIRDNNLTNNMYGIYIKASSTGNIIEKNSITGGKRGIVFHNETNSNVARNNTFSNVKSHDYFLDYNADLMIDNQNFSDIEIKGADGTNYVTITNSGTIKGQDTDVLPLTTALCNSTLVIMNS